MGITINRREVLLGLSGCGLGGVAACASADAQLPARRIPGTDESLPVVGLGSTKPVRYIAEAGTGPLESVIDVLMRYGGRVVDTSPRPAELDEQFGRVLQRPALRDLFVAAKVKVEGKDEGIASMRQTLELFGREPLDLMQIESMIDYEIQWPTLKAMRDRGAVRYIGVTVAHERLYGELEAFMQAERPDFVQLNYSVMEPAAEQRLLPLAAELGIAVLVNGPFMNGEYFGYVQGRELPEWAGEFGCESWAQYSLKYILANPAVTCVLTETTKPEHMEDNVRAGLGTFPEAPARRRMRELGATLRGA
ncbi:MAG: aldo/keto reductase [Woeseiaceae bacterium]|nr:aldo/keto reductase [Woeseiaceae bacterium]